MTVNSVVIVELSVGGTFIPGPSKSSKNYIPVVQIFFFRYNCCFFRVELKKKTKVYHTFVCVSCKGRNETFQLSRREQLGHFKQTRCYFQILAYTGKILVMA